MNNLKRKMSESEEKMEDSEEKLLRILAFGEMVDQYRIREEIKADIHGQPMEVPIYVYIKQPFNTELEKEYFKMIRSHQTLMLPENVKYIQMVSKNQQYYYNMSTSLRDPSDFMSEDQMRYFTTEITQEDYDEIRNKENCNCRFCKYPTLRCENN